MRFAEWLTKKTNFVIYSTALFGTMLAVIIIVIFSFSVSRIYYPDFIYLSLGMVVLSYVAGFAWGHLMWAFVIEPRLPGARVIHPRREE